MDTDNVFDELLTLIAIANLEVDLTMKDGSVKKVVLDTDKIMAQIQEAKNLADKAASLEKEANWLAEAVGKYWGRRIKYGIQNQTVQPDYEKADYWREAARKAVQEQTNV